MVTILSKVYRGSKDSFVITINKKARHIMDIKLGDILEVNIVDVHKGFGKNNISKDESVLLGDLQTERREQRRKPRIKL